MEAGTSDRNQKAQRIVAAMRESVAAKGAAASTFDEVAQRAGVSRGLLHYYFGSKEKLLVEVVRHDCEIRIAELGERLDGAANVTELVAAMLAGFEDFVEDQAALIFELFTASRHVPEIRGEVGELYSSVRSTIAKALTAKQDEGVVALRADPQSVASVIVGLGDGAALQVLSDPDWDATDAVAAGVQTVRFLLGE